MDTVGVMDTDMGTVTVMKKIKAVFYNTALTQFL